MMSERKNSSGLVDAPTRRQLIAGVADFAYGGVDSPGARFQGEPEARV